MIDRVSILRSVTPQCIVLLMFVIEEEYGRGPSIRSIIGAAYTIHHSLFYIQSAGALICRKIIQ